MIEAAEERAQEKADLEKMSQELAQLEAKTQSLATLPAVQVMTPKGQTRKKQPVNNPKTQPKNSK
jgi:hypothetical protein